MTWGIPNVKTHSCYAIGCRSDEWQCADGECIDDSLYCNRRDDCADRSDETACGKFITQ